MTILRNRFVCDAVAWNNEMSLALTHWPEANCMLEVGNQIQQEHMAWLLNPFVGRYWKRHFRTLNYSGLPPNDGVKLNDVQHIIMDRNDWYISDTPLPSPNINSDILSKLKIKILMISREIIKIENFPIKSFELTLRIFSYFTAVKWTWKECPMWRELL